ncbi:hypothetical protein CRP01_02560 [Flavilitoribacter nigricans DSM 23189 = NBRC 102662]|uniref:Uncharacterized protein n=1 Tax=Flavilitoribacter nigricans (strain ATCC 23147 / DSM 23189 / NBRC 102662 / NCIMB 1420 / SS-2) TaxID=1122177 RepID=A0A2D0NKF6_FLAN2|nr:hypothetical protein CRP01_02560 [Flavilitoribacter nigricans DSM 23189 = NBRC 102662]
MCVGFVFEMQETPINSAQIRNQAMTVVTPGNDLRDWLKTSAAGEKPGFCRQLKAIFHCIAQLRS